VLISRYVLGQELRAKNLSEEIYERMTRIATMPPLGYGPVLNGKEYGKASESPAIERNDVLTVTVYVVFALSGFEG
jgi:hypothetical protein